jgi:hypothetical protein
MVGRPTLFSLGLATLICERIANGETLKAICAESEMPSQSSVFLWLSQNPEFSEMYARAREASADVLVEEAREIADDGSADYVVRSRDGKVELAVQHEHISRSKLRIEQRRWEAARRKPRAYGERRHADQSGSTGLDTMTDQELQAELLELLSTGRVKLPGGIELVEVEDEDPWHGGEPLA